MEGKVFRSRFGSGFLYLQVSGRPISVKAGRKKLTSNSSVILPPKSPTRLRVSGQWGPLSWRGRRSRGAGTPEPTWKAWRFRNVDVTVAWGTRILSWLWSSYFAESWLSSQLTQNKRKGTCGQYELGDTGDITDTDQEVVRAHFREKERLSGQRYKGLVISQDCPCHCPHTWPKFTG